MSTHFAKKYSTEARDPETGKKIQVYVLSCVPCKIYGKTFVSKAKRDREAEDHK